VVTAGGGGTYRSCQNHESISLHDLLSTGRHLFGVSSITSLKSNLWTALTTQNITENNCINYKHKTQLHFNPYTFNGKKAVSGDKQEVVNFPTAQTPAKGNCKLLTQYQYLHNAYKPKTLTTLSQTYSDLRNKTKKYIPRINLTSQQIWFCHLITPKSYHFVSGVYQVWQSLLSNMDWN
jgi:hypothetical protein